MSESNPQSVADAKKVIHDILYITIATASKAGEPWNSPVYSAHDDKYNFFWVSWLNNQHSQNIKENSNIFLVIYNSTVPEGTGFGVYLKGTAKALESDDMDEIKRASALLAGRKNKKPRNPEEYLGDYPRRVHKFVPEQVWVNGDGDIDGNYVDVRIDITKDLLN